LSLIAIISLKVTAQIKKGDVHIGIAGFPIIDIFNSYPDNKITGLGLLGQIGFFPHKNLYLGLNPYYVKVKNRFPELGTMTEENQRIFGINTSMSFYMGLSTKFYVYGGVNFGLGAADHQRFNVPMNISSKVTYPIFTIAPVLGLHYFITKNFTLNFNLPLINIKYISYSNIENFKTLAPTIGVGCFF